MPSIESIEHKLFQLDATTFQRLGDDYFSQCANVKYNEFRPVAFLRNLKTAWQMS